MHSKTTPHGYSSARPEDTIARAIPFHAEIHDRLAHAICTNVPNACNALELGVGTGITTERIRKSLPLAHIDAIDTSRAMLAETKRKVGHTNIRYCQGNYTALPFPDINELVVSMIGVHHLGHKGKRALFRKVYRSLLPGGVFIFGDLVTYRDPRVAALNHARRYHYLVGHASDEATLIEWAHHHMFLNRLVAPVEDQIDWLTEAGFSVSTEFLEMNTALLLCAKK